MLVNQLVRDRKIAILVLQEAHLNDERVESLNRVFGRNMTILHSPDPINSTGARGVALVINKRVLKDCTPVMRQIVPGRAILTSIPWAEDRTLKILNIYAPNDATDNEAFWVRLGNERLGRIDFLLGDFNLVEDRADRVPQREDPERPREALQALCEKLDLIDGWRSSNPLAPRYTFLQESTSSQSRLDRIYVKRQTFKDCSDWDITEPGIPTDHLLASVAIQNYKAPFIGKGRWVMPTHLLEDQEMKKSMLALAAALVRQIESMPTRTAESNPQTMYAAFKAELSAAARTRAREKVPKMQKRIDRMREDLTKTL
ncbi:DNase I-like protein, partial [Trametes versicolor FP-101664 SS1]|uniref:DNase I-like protein n=1 Tax=Trametes versicolor (strain FP-101664) TaxID=717944 RepID=UPI0004621293